MYSYIDKTQIQTYKVVNRSDKALIIQEIISDLFSCKNHNNIYFLAMKNFGMPLSQ